MILFSNFKWNIFIYYFFIVENIIFGNIFCISYFVIEFDNKSVLLMCFFDIISLKLVLGKIYGSD